MINTSPRSPDEQFEAHLLHLTQSAAAYPWWSPYRALLLLLVSTFRGIKAALRQLAAHYRDIGGEAGHEATPEPECEAGTTAPRPRHRTQATRPRQAADQAAIRPRARPQAATTAPEAENPTPPVRGWAAPQTGGGERSRPTGTPTQVAPHPFSPVRRAAAPLKFSTWERPMLWHAHIVPISEQ